MTATGRWCRSSNVWAWTGSPPSKRPACQEALDQGVFSAAVIINILARKRDPQPAAILSIPDALRLTHEPLADCARYDSLRRAS